MSLLLLLFREQIQDCGGSVEVQLLKNRMNECQRPKIEATVLGIPTAAVGAYT